MKETQELFTVGPPKLLSYWPRAIVEWFTKPASDAF
jgi:hypothetical protein